MSALDALKREARALARPKKARASAWFFKTGKGEYGEGDRFLGFTVPEQRKLAKKYRELSLSDVQRLLKSPFHEHRLTALLILVLKFQSGEERERRKLHDFYLRNTDRVNNWDLVDSSAHVLVGTFVLDRSRRVIHRLAKSGSLWDQRISVVATYPLIKNGEFDDILRLAKRFLTHEHDLIHKAVGWMLREVGSAT